MAVKRGCPVCLTEECRRDGAPMGVVPRFVARELDGAVDWRPCFGCNRERWSAWQAGELSPTTSLDDAAHESARPTPADSAAMAAALQRAAPVIEGNESLHERARKRAALDKLRARYPEQFEGRPADGTTDGDALPT